MAGQLRGGESNTQLKGNKTWSLVVLFDLERLEFRKRSTGNFISLGVCVLDVAVG